MCGIEKHIDMIQGVISRMAHCSFLLKGWSVILVSAVFALAAKDSNICIVWVAFFPALAFWGLDGYYLRQERLYRKLYDSVRMSSGGEVDYSLNATSHDDEVESWLSVCFSNTLAFFHGPLVLAVFAVALILYNVRLF